MESTKHPPDEQWLIKTQGKVLGPFSTAEIKTALQNRRLSPMDDITECFGRWKMLRDEVAFLQVTKALKSHGSAGNELTATSTQTLASTVSGIRSSDITKSITESTADDATESGVSNFAGLDIPKPVEKPAPAKITARVITAREKIAASDSSQSFGAKEDYRFQKRAQKSAMTNWLIILVAGVFIGAGGWYYFDVQTKKAKSENYFDVYNRAVTAKSQGLYKRSLDYFQQAKQLNSTDPRVDFEMAPLLIAFEKQTVVGRRILEKSMTPSDSRDVSTLSYTAIALSYLIDGDLRGAEESLDKALSLDPNYFPALYDRAVLEYKNGNYAEAEQRFYNLIQKGKRTGEVLLGQALSSIELMRQGREPRRGYPVLVEGFESYLSNSLSLRHQIQVMLAFSYVRQSKIDRAAQVVSSMLTEDLINDEDFSSDILLDTSFSEWKNLFQYCDLLVSSLPQDGTSKSLLAYCQLKSGAQDDARQIMQAALGESPKSPIVHHLNGVVLKKMGQDLEAKGSIDMAIASHVPGAYSVRAAICENEGDLACAESNYQKYLSFSAKNVSGYAGLARVAFKKGNKKQANDWIIKGQAVSKTYSPLWELQSR